MASKLAAARTASFSGVRAVIAASKRPDVLVEAANDLDVGTTFMPNDRKLGARKLWIGFASSVDGAVTVDDGAVRALVDLGRSLLPAGVVGVTGDFGEESIVEIRDTRGRVIARGMVLCDADTLRRTRGKRTGDLPPEFAHEVVHRDDLVVLT